MSNIKNAIKSLVEQFPHPLLFLDVGANGGEDALDLLNRISESIVHCFEPDPRAFARLKTNAEKAPGRCHIHNVALGDYDGTARFYQSSGIGLRQKQWDKSGSLLRPKEHRKMIADVAFNEGIIVPQIRLDTWCDSVQPEIVHLIWMDAQGAEGLIVKGGRKAISRSAFMFVESYQVEMYEGQMLRDEFLKLLGSDWEMLGAFRNDVLLWNRRFPVASLRL